ncbi:L-rhamnose mutarotase [Pseudonocardia sp. GCM10023141]|uniref:L-rhamnose mutarotase n=1 Tax=Pseudonocardia sp. GCM10023141 TaxID=3252653 RepID=UPI00360C3156
MERVCFTMQVRAGHLDEYRRRHGQVWPQMQAALRDAGWGDYSLFLRDDGLVVGYVETESFERALAGMDGLEINRRWQQEMAPLIEARPGRRVDESLERLPEIFHLD